MNDNSIWKAKNLMAILAERDWKNVVLCDYQVYTQVKLIFTRCQFVVLYMNQQFQFYFLIKKIGWIFTTWQQKKKKSSVTHATDFLVKKMCPKSAEFEEKSWLIPLVDG